MVKLSWIILWVFLTTILGSAGSLSFKFAMNQLKTMSAKNIVKNKWVWIGFFVYLFSSYTNIQLYKYLPYDVAYPLTSLTYVWTIILSYFVFKEKITLYKVIAIISVTLGVFLISI
ncbi:EamA family transporter [Enterococcus faecalis]|nr:EamA family transporter [Enterococcus faecalis]